MAGSKWAAMWADFPPLHKKRLYQVAGVYAACAIGLGAWVWQGAPEASKEWSSRVPFAEVEVRNIYLTPQITEQGDDASSFDAPADTTAGTSPVFISLVMTDMGLGREATERAINDLPPQVALAFSPYAKGLSEWSALTREKNRDTLLLLPMEPYSYPKDDPGPKALLTRLGEKENAEYLKWALEQMPAASGVMNFMGSKFLTDRKRLPPVFKTLQKEGKFFIETSAAGEKHGQPFAQEAGLSYLPAAVQVDVDAAELPIRQSLLDLEKSARENGYAIGVIQPYPLTFNVVKAWADTLEKRGIYLIPLVQMMKDKAGYAVSVGNAEKTAESKDGEPAGHEQH